MIKYNSVTTRVDMETAEIISKRKSEQDYLKVKTVRRVETKDESNARGYEYRIVTIHYTALYKKSEQLKLI